jgi:hypothetical protein
MIMSKHEFYTLRFKIVCWFRQTFKPCNCEEAIGYGKHVVCGGYQYPKKEKSISEIAGNAMHKELRHRLACAKNHLRKLKWRSV